MQSLESSCQEADVSIPAHAPIPRRIANQFHSVPFPLHFQFMVNEALNKLRRSTNDSSSSLLIDHNDYTSAEGSSYITNPSRSPPATLVAPVKQPHSSIGSQSGCEKRSASDSQHSLSSSYTSGGNPSKRSRISSSSSSSTSFPATGSAAGTTSSKNSTTTSASEHCRDTPFFDLHDKLRELYGLLYYNDEQNRRTETRVSFPFSFLLFCFCLNFMRQHPFKLWIKWFFPPKISLYLADSECPVEYNFSTN